MKNLPDRPHLDHLRQQAKDLLVGLRDTAPATTLAQAQNRLAEQYGFPSWVALKAEVDRLRDGRDELPPELAKELAQRFRLGSVTGPATSVAEDELGRLWSVATDRGRWAVTAVDDWIPIVDVETEFGLRAAAAAAGVDLPLAVRSVDGGIVEAIGGSRWRVEQWRHSGPPLAAPAGAAVVRRVGEILATVHGLRLPVDRISPWHALPVNSWDWPAYAGRAAKRTADWASALAAAAPALAGLERLASVAGDATAPPVLCHNTLGPALARRGPGGALVILGWEHAGGQPPAWELADGLLHWTVDPNGGINPAGARALVAGYRDRAGEVPELDPDAFAGAATSLLNYLAGELERALSAGSAEERRQADRSVQHLLTHLPSPATFDELLLVSGVGAGRTR